MLDRKSTLGECILDKMAGCVGSVVLVSRKAIQASEIINDIRGDMKPSELMEKYEISRRGLQSILKQLAEEREVRAIEIVLDIRSGMTDAELIQKHGLSPAGLSTAFNKLVKGKFISENELGKRSPYEDDARSFPSIRQTQRNYPILPILVQDRDRPDNVGKVRDMTENGLGLTGFDAKVGDIRALDFEPDNLAGIGSLSLKAKCRWTQKETDGECASGFQIVEFLKGKTEDLRFLIRVHTVRYQGRWDRENGETTSNVQLDFRSSLKRIRARPVVADVRSGMTDSDIMAKYGVSPKGLNRILKKLVDTEAISHDELYQMCPSYREVMDRPERRVIARKDVTKPLRIYEANTSECGFVRDISEKGLRVAGIRTGVGETKSLSLPVDLSVEKKVLQFEGVCRWAGTRGTYNKYVLAGYEITGIKDETLQDLRDLIQLFDVGRSKIS